MTEVSIQKSESRRQIAEFGIWNADYGIWRKLLDGLVPLYLYGYKKQKYLTSAFDIRCSLFDILILHFFLLPWTLRLLPYSDT